MSYSDLLFGLVEMSIIALAAFLFMGCSPKRVEPTGEVNCVQSAELDPLLTDREGAEAIKACHVLWRNQ